MVLAGVEVVPWVVQGVLGAVVQAEEARIAV